MRLGDCSLCGAVCRACRRLPYCNRGACIAGGLADCGRACDNYLDIRPAYRRTPVLAGEEIASRKAHCQWHDGASALDDPSDGCPYDCRLAHICIPISFRSEVPHQTAAPLGSHLRRTSRWNNDDRHSLVGKAAIEGPPNSRRCRYGRGISKFQRWDSRPPRRATLIQRGP